MKVEQVKRRWQKVEDITEQYGEYDADSWVWRAQLGGFDPNPPDLHGSQMSSKRNFAAVSSTGSGQPVEYPFAQLLLSSLLD